MLINSSANFILYCAMSAQFRSTFRRVFSDCLGGSRSQLDDVQLE